MKWIKDMKVQNKNKAGQALTGRPAIVHRKRKYSPFSATYSIKIILTSQCFSVFSISHLFPQLIGGTKNGS